MKKFFYVVPVLICFFSACREDVLVEHPDDGGFYASSFRYDEIFDKFWQGMNNYYVYWSVEDANYWNNVYKKYRPKFKSMGIIVPEVSNGVELPQHNVNIAFDLFKEMTAPLHDGHLCISVEPGFFLPTSIEAAVQDNYMIRPVYEKVKKRAGVENSALFLSDWSGYASSSTNNNFNFFDNVISDLIDNYQCSYISSDLRVGAGTRAHTQGGIILYFYFSSFLLKQTLADEGGTGNFTQVWNYFMNNLSQEDLRGIIFDVRGNQGGANEDIELLIAPLIQNKLLIAETRVKKSLAPLEYKPWSPYTISPSSQAASLRNKNIPIVLLCNDYSVSCAELLTLAVKQMPNGYVIGRQTFGALGPRLSDTSPIKTNGGSFSGGPFWLNVTQAGLQTRGPDKRNYDGIGIAPHKVVELRGDDFVAQVPADAQLIAAILAIDADALFDMPH